MKKTILTAAAVFIGLIVFSFTPDENATVTTITVTSEKPTTFDLYQHLDSKEFKNLKGLKTPYQTKLLASDGKLIFHQNGTGSKLKIEIKKDKNVITADWLVTVVLIENGKLATFGMD
jgi:hypothetical protein